MCGTPKFSACGGPPHHFSTKFLGRSTNAECLHLSNWFFHLSRDAYTNHFDNAQRSLRTSQQLALSFCGAANTHIKSIKPWAETRPYLSVNEVFALQRDGFSNPFVHWQRRVRTSQYSRYLGSWPPRAEGARKKWGILSPKLTSKFGIFVK